MTTRINKLEIRADYAETEISILQAEMESIQWHIVEHK